MDHAMDASGGTAPCLLVPRCPVCRSRVSERARRCFVRASCPVCLEEAEPVFALPCGHVLCGSHVADLGVEVEPRPELPECWQKPDLATDPFGDIQEAFGAEPPSHAAHRGDRPVTSLVRSEEIRLQPQLARSEGSDSFTISVGPGGLLVDGVAVTRGPGEFLDVLSYDGSAAVRIMQGPAASPDASGAAGGDVSSSAVMGSLPPSSAATQGPTSDLVWSLSRGSAPLAQVEVREEGVQSWPRWWRWRQGDAREEAWTRHWCEEHQHHYWHRASTGESFWEAGPRATEYL